MPDQAQTTTLRRLLTREKPAVPSTITSTNKSNGDWAKLKKTRARIWDEFNLDNLNKGFAHILDTQLPEELVQLPSPDTTLGGLTINVPHDLFRFTEHNNSVMKPCLNVAKFLLGFQPGVALRHSHSSADRTLVCKVPDIPGKTNVDHFIGIDDFPHSHLLVGFVRPSSKWSGRKLANCLGDPPISQLLSLSQLANQCVLAKTRYGYIQTDEELTVCRFATRNSEQTVAFMPVPWSRHGPGTLTTDLALWWLAVLAMCGARHREITEEDDIVPLDKWDEEDLGDGRRTKRHAYSGLQILAEPTLPPANGPPLPNGPFAFDLNWLNLGGPENPDDLNADLGAGLIHNALGEGGAEAFFGNIFEDLGNMESGGS